MYLVCTSEPQPAPQSGEGQNWEVPGRGPSLCAPTGGLSDCRAPSRRRRRHTAGEGAWPASVTHHTWQDPTRYKIQDTSVAAQRRGAPTPCSGLPRRGLARHGTGSALLSFLLGGRGALRLSLPHPLPPPSPTFTFSFIELVLPPDETPQDTRYKIHPCPNAVSLLPLAPAPSARVQSAGQMVCVSVCRPEGRRNDLAPSPQWGQLY